MQEFVSAALMLIGAGFLVIGGLGLVRLPDLFTRMSSNTKAATLGVGCILLAVAIYFNELAITIRALAIIAFLFLTAPVAAHMIGRAAFVAGVPLWKNSVVNELADKYGRTKHESQQDGKLVEGVAGTDNEAEALAEADESDGYAQT